MNYLLVKHLHVSAATLSIIFFAVRAWWSVTNSARLQWRAVKVLPHIIDTVLLVCGVILTFMLGGLQPWIVAKLIALVLDRKSVGWGKSVSVRVDLGGRRTINKK